MKKRLLFKKLLTGSLFLLQFLSQAQACDFIYRDTVASPNMNHSVSFYLYQNCNTTSSSVFSWPVSYSANGGTTVNETFSGPLTNMGLGNPFCPSQTPACSPSTNLNYQKTGVTYTFSSKMNISTPGFIILIQTLV